jgi:hypothetical protein
MTRVGNIPGASSIADLRDDVAGGRAHMPEDAQDDLNAIAR